MLVTSKVSFTQGVVPQRGFTVFEYTVRICIFMTEFSLIPNRAKNKDDYNARMQVCCYSIHWTAVCNVCSSGLIIWPLKSGIHIYIRISLGNNHMGSDLCMHDITGVTLPRLVGYCIGANYCGTLISRKFNCKYLVGYICLLRIYVVGTDPFAKLKLRITAKLFDSQNVCPAKICTYTVVGTECCVLPLSNSNMLAHHLCDLYVLTYVHF